jgi:hypothetical protein
MNLDDINQYTRKLVFQQIAVYRWMILKDALYLLSIYFVFETAASISDTHPDKLSDCFPFCQQ